MLDELRAFIALESAGTVSAAAVKLRLTQSAVSKRIQSLENQLEYKVVEAKGRKLRITSLGHQLLAKAKPLVLEFEALKDLHEAAKPKTIRLGISDSIASSWGPKLIQRVFQQHNELKLELHVHRSTTILEHLRAGKYEFGLVTGLPQERNLVWEPLALEAMVLVGKPSSQASHILTIEKQSATWKEIGEAAKSHLNLRNRQIVHVESFSAALQMAREGFGQALVPAGLAAAFSVRKPFLTPFSPKLQRHIFLVGRKSLFDTKSGRDLQRSMSLQAREIVVSE